MVIRTLQDELEGKFEKTGKFLPVAFQGLEGAMGKRGFWEGFL
jgi:hypothetical protein